MSKLAVFRPPSSEIARPAAHAEIFNVLADAANDSLAGPLLSSGVGLAYDLMIVAGRAANGMIASSRQRLLAHLRAGDAEGAALETEKHLRVPAFYVARLANCMVDRASA